MAYLSKISDLDPSLMDADPEQIYIPKVLFEHNDFKGLKHKAILLYSFLLNRLRDPFDFIQKGYDDNGATYVHFKVEDLCELLNQSKTTIIFLKRQLTQYGLIEEVKAGSNQPNRIYLTDKLVPYIKE
ncbi:TPA: helix-turn-helix domain-containing protein [Streptococcus agalactiae]|uniref:replication initiator protein A n=1 Tax=Streptococcus anginosus TaxID=1328 RepID=UPI002ABD01B9|nr:helix-turn-helix domain-containing protein [Streptococcus agalactiae]HEN9135907.1 helix-turn-helix domain-containing protein [Streptococcus agalactiae]HEO4923513.1 helix-turn-helix domain-containing protein [Streptococcus agalactiae]HEO8335406.1 helix-turn-helix domain-containing protein [Streptococcus agalactiae]HEP2968783.1 helix-turn-helix domain-containing protein [Streptococcus pyogenes]